MRWYLTFALSILAISLLACRVPKPVSSTGIIDEKVIEIWASTDLIQPGQTVKLRATLTNHSGKSQIIELKDRPVLDLVVVAGTAEQPTRIRWSDGKPLTADLTRLALQPGESKSIELSYVVQGCCNSVQAYAEFVDTGPFPPIRPGIVIFVGSYPHGALP